MGNDVDIDWAELDDDEFESHARNVGIRALERERRAEPLEEPHAEADVRTIGSRA